MSTVQLKITFPAKKNSFRLSPRKCEKENFKKETPKKQVLADRSPFKSKFENVCSLSPTKRTADLHDEASPPKQYLLSPSGLKNIHIQSPKYEDEYTRNKIQSSSKKSPVKKELFPDIKKDSLIAARRALHSSVPTDLPARTDKLNELIKILLDRLDDNKPQSIYISGPPGTGKTACLNFIIRSPKIVEGYRIVYVNCTGLKSAGAIYSHICQELNLKTNGRSAKLYQAVIQKYLTTSKKMSLFVLDEMDQLECRSQSVLYSILEWGIVPGSRLVLVGIANALDLTDRALPRLSARSNLKPTLFHFPSYTRQQIIEIISHRLSQAGCCDVFEGSALQFLASKIATVSGDVRRALDIARRVIEMSQTSESKKISVMSVLETVNKVYSTSESLCSNSPDSSDSFPLQQKLLICSLMLIRLNSKSKDVTTVGKLHEVYKKVCEKRNFRFLDMSEFISVAELVEVRGIIKLQGKVKNRMSKVVLQWDEKEVSSALQDKQLLASILDDKACISR